MGIEIVGPEIEAKLDWIALTEAIEAGHRLPRAEVADSFLRRGADTLLTRSAWIDGLGLAIKGATIFPENPKMGIPSISGVVNLLNGTDGSLAIAVNAVQAARAAHRHMGIGADGLVTVRHTDGNPDAHIVLRGGERQTNYRAASIARAPWPTTRWL